MNEFDKHFRSIDLLKFSLAPIIMQIFLSLYTIVDGMFISRFAGTIPLSALNMIYPMINLAWGLSIMIATGGSAYISKEMGEQKFDHARKDFTFLVLITIIVSIVFGILGLIFIDPIIRFLGVSDIQYQPGYTYLFINLIFMPMLFLHTFFDSFFITTGKPKIGLCLTILSGCINIFLDYLFVGIFQWGISGAAYATCIGFCVSAIYGLYYFFFHRNGLLYFVKWNINFKMVLKSCTNGFSEMVTNIAIAVTCLLFNLKFMEYYGEAGVAAICIVYYLQFLFIALFFGYSIGVSPILAYKYGAKDTKQMREITSSSIKIITIVSIFIFIVSLCTIRPLMEFFTTSIDVQNIVLDGFIYYSISFLFIGFNINASAMFTSLQNGGISALLSFNRTFLFLVISILALPILFGVNGLWASTSFAEGIGLFFSTYFYIKMKKKYKY